MDSNLTEQQIDWLAKIIDEWLRNDPHLRMEMAREQAGQWTLKEFNEIWEAEHPGEAFSAI